jgi:hypothetical protein
MLTEIEQVLVALLWLKKSVENVFFKEEGVTRTEK